MIVVDASVLANALGDDGHEGTVARAALAEAGDFTAPDLVDVETLSVFRKQWLASFMSSDRFEIAVTDLGRLDFERVPTRRLMQRAFELRANVTAYDAIYVALAEVLDCELVTGDRRLAAASGPRCRMRVVAA